MYSVDDRDRVAELMEIPWPEAGAPMPLLLQNDNRAVLVYFVGSRWADLNKHDRSSEHELTAVVSFPVYGTMFGPPNDEAMRGHPLSSRGLASYRAFEIRDSSWVRGLEQRNAVHPRHNAVSFLATWRHFAITFHDGTFECVARDFTAETVQVSREEAVRLAHQRLLP